MVFKKSRETCGDSLKKRDTRQSTIRTVILVIFIINGYPRYILSCDNTSILGSHLLQFMVSSYDSRFLGNFF